MGIARGHLFSFTLCVAVASAIVTAAACGGDSESQFNPPQSETNPDVFVPPIGNEDSGQADVNASADANGTLTVTPPTATVQVDINNGVVSSNPPATFTALSNGTPVTANWVFDRGDLGDVDAKTGVFLSSARAAGDGTVIAQANGREGRATVTVKLKAVQNGGESGTLDAGGGGAGGYGGVGGEPLGAAISAGDMTKLRGTPTADATMKWLYPYDKTVWPRSILAPLLQWDTSKTAKAVYVKLSQATLTFEGFYSLAGRTGDATKRVRLDQEYWKRALNGNDGTSFLHVEVRILGTDDVVYGPLAEDWLVSPAPLAGTVYYNSYDSLLTGAAVGPDVPLGGVLSIKVSAKDPVRAASPTLAIPGKAGKCHVCHALSADGSTLFVQDGENPVGIHQDYHRSLSFDLTKTTDPVRAQAAYDGASDKHKFTWAAPYPDGSFALASSRFTREARRPGPSALFAKTDGSLVPSTGLPADVDAVSPAFSPDGRHVVFNFWQGTAPAGVTLGGHSLALYDFDCGAAVGSTTCVGATKTFKNGRALYTDAARFPAWPSFTPDGKAVAFHNTLLGGDCPDAPRGSTADPNSNDNCQLTTWYRAESEIWLGVDGAPASRMNALNGLDAAGNSVLPEGPDHTAGLDARLNYMPTVNPVAAGGYFWVVFTSRRRYGNVLTAHPFNEGGNPFGSAQKKLWVAAIDAKTGAIDRSHPAFYLPGQELASGNSRGYWVVDPCKPTGGACDTGDECCGGFCRKDPEGGALVCGNKPPSTCAAELEACKSDADCCDANQACINSRCARRTPPVPR